MYNLCLFLNDPYSHYDLYYVDKKNFFLTVDFLKFAKIVSKSIKEVSNEHF